jgi:EmrB/QacA subfamily drug resistance transporter
MEGEQRVSTAWGPIGLCLAMLLSSLGTSIANVALPTLAERFGASFGAVQWVVLAYLLAATIAIVGAGRLGDIIGRRRLLGAGILLFAAASLACGAAPDLRLLIAARAAQGVGAAIMIALTTALIGDIAPRSKLGGAMGLLGAMSAVGTALGPPLGGLLIAAFGWRSIFLINLPFGLAAFLIVLRCLPSDPAPAKERPRFDLAGASLLALGLGAYALALTAGRLGRWEVLLLALAALALGTFAWVETRATSPLIRLAMLRDPALSASLAINALVATVLMATLVVGPFYLTRALGLGSAGLGLVMSAGPLVAALAGVPSGRAVDRFGTRPTTLAGLAAIGFGCAALALAPAEAGIAGYVLPIVVVTSGYALFQAANNSAVMAGIAGTERGLAGGLLNLSRNLGLISGVSVMGAVFAVATGSPDVATASAEAVGATFGLAALLAGAALALAIGAGGRRPRSVVTASS